MTDAEIGALARSGEYIQAIKEYRALHGGGLKEAKDAVDILASGRTPAGPEIAHERPAPDEEVRVLAREGRKIEAIKLYRERSGLGLAQAKAVIDSLG